jgi:hypothetical protein
MHGRIALLVFAAALALPSTALARGDRDVLGGLGMNHIFAASFFHGGGSRSNLSTKKFGEGTQNVVRVEAAALWKPTVFGNWGGMEGGMDLGKESFASMDKDEVEWWFDLWWGFPITVLRLGEADQQFGLVLGGSPGIGVNTFAGGQWYAYIKGRAALTLVPELLQAEVSYQWTPLAASSHDWDKGDGCNHATLRTQLFLALNRDGMGVQFYVDLDQANYERYAQNALLKKNSQQYPDQRDPLLGNERMAYQRLWRAGVGFVF